MAVCIIDRNAIIARTDGIAVSNPQGSHYQNFEQPGHILARGGSRHWTCTWSAWTLPPVPHPVFGHRTTRAWSRRFRWVGKST